MTPPHAEPPARNDPLAALEIILAHGLRTYKYEHVLLAASEEFQRVRTLIQAASENERENCVTKKMSRALAAFRVKS